VAGANWKAILKQENAPAVKKAVAGVSEFPMSVLSAHGRWLFDHGKQKTKQHKYRETRCDYHDYLPPL
jgi:hypothetical protein